MLRRLVRTDKDPAERHQHLFRQLEFGQSVALRKLRRIPEEGTITTLSENRRVAVLPVSGGGWHIAHRKVFTQYATQKEQPRKWNVTVGPKAAVSFSIAL
jgi:hypothetical protein